MAALLPARDLQRALVTKNWRGLLSKRLLERSNVRLHLGEDVVAVEQHMAGLDISVIIPTINEAACLLDCLSAVQAQREVAEVIVVDAGSQDGTVTLAKAAGAQVVMSDRRQRAHQLNLGAAVARGDVLWFLHADTWVSSRTARSIVEALEDPGVVGGGFRRRFRSGSPFLLGTCWLASLRSRYFGLYFGDQSLYVRRRVFSAISGFSDVPVFEDLDLCQRLKREGRLVCLGPAVRSSARRFAKRGAVSVTLGDCWLTMRYLRGRSPGAISERRGKH